MSGTVGLIANDSARYTLFAASLINMRTPPNTHISWAIGSDRIYGRNRIVQSALDKGSEWVFFLDDDHAFAPDILLRLLSHDVGICASLYMARSQPFHPIAYMKHEDLWVPVSLEDQPEKGLLEIHAAGTGGMLVRTEVFHKMEQPWFEHGIASEDLIFCDKARALGFPIYLDLATHLGHISPASIWPSFEEGDWGVTFAVSDGLMLRVKVGEEVPTQE